MISPASGSARSLSGRSRPGRCTSRRATSGSSPGSGRTTWTTPTISPAPPPGSDSPRRGGRTAGDLRPSSSRKCAPGADAKSDEEIAAFIRGDRHHLVSPGRNLPDGGSMRWAVVDPELRVIGLEGLRVADASIFPALPSSNTHAPQHSRWRDRGISRECPVGSPRPPTRIVPQGGFKGRCRLRPERHPHAGGPPRRRGARRGRTFATSSWCRGIVEVGRGRNAGGRSARRGRAAGRRDPRLSPDVLY